MHHIIMLPEAQHRLTLYPLLELGLSDLPINLQNPLCSGGKNTATPSLFPHPLLCFWKRKLLTLTIGEVWQEEQDIPPYVFPLCSMPGDI